MKYISPVKLFYEDLHDAGQLTTGNLSLIKRKLLAEAELSENKTVVRNGREFSKDEIVNLFSNLEKDLQPDMHMRVYQNTALLNFLETGEYDFYETAIDVDAIISDPEFLAFVRPWLMAIWPEVILNHFRVRNWAGLVQLMEMGNALIEPVLLPDLLEPLEDRLNDFASEAKTRIELSITRKYLDEELVDVYINSDLIKFLNLLPYTFGHFRNNYMIVVVNITVKVFNTRHRSEAYTYAKIAEPLDCNEHYKNELLTRIKFYFDNIGSADSGRSFKFNWIWLIFIVLSTIVRMGQCNRSSNTPYTPSSSFSNEELQKILDASKSAKPYAAEAEAKPTALFTLYESSAHSLQYDEQKIAQVVQNKTNRAQLSLLVKSLRANIEKLPIKKPNANKTVNDIDIKGLCALVDSTWHWDLEPDNVNASESELVLQNNTDMDMIVLYKYSLRLVPMAIAPHSAVSIHLTDGKNILAPYFGIDWNDKVLLRQNFEGTMRNINTGWFTRKPESVDGTNNLLLFKTQHNVQSADTIRFDYTNPGFAGAFIGNNVSLK